MVSEIVRMAGHIRIEVDDRLFFAGEATSREFFCTCHGAYLTCQRAMAEIAAVLRGSGAAR